MTENNFGLLPWDSIPQLYDGSFELVPAGTKPYRKPLNSQATQEKTLQLYSDLQKMEPYYDYASFYTDGSLDHKKIVAWVCRKDLAFETEIACVMRCIPVDGVIYGYDILNREGLSELMEKVVKITDYIVPSFNYEVQFQSLGSTKRGKGSLEYAISLSKKSDFMNRYYGLYTLEIGTDIDGKYYIHTRAGYAYIDSATYLEFIGLCETIHREALAAK